MKTIKEIDKMISELKAERKELENEENEKFLEHAKTNVGRCFIVNDTVYVKVINVPQKEYTLTGSYFNEYQYLALYINNTIGQDPFYFDTIFSGAWGEGNLNGYSDKYKEISKEEFNTQLENKLIEFKNYIINI